MSAIVFLILRILLAASLYSFLIVCLVALWRDTRFQTAWLSSRKAPAINLTIHSTDGTEQTHDYTVPEVAIGRDPGCDCTLSDETVSYHHARLKYHHSHWWLEDLHSTNGTQLNKQPLNVPAVVISGDVINCGIFNISISISGDSILPPEP